MTSQPSSTLRDIPVEARNRVGGVAGVGSEVRPDLSDDRRGDNHADSFTMLFVALPMYALYEAGIVIERMTDLV